MDAPVLQDVLACEWGGWDFVEHMFGFLNCQVLSFCDLIPALLRDVDYLLMAEPVCI